jgi:hypothetical protein
MFTCLCDQACMAAVWLAGCTLRSGVTTANYCLMRRGCCRTRVYQVSCYSDEAEEWNGEEVGATDYCLKMA